MAVNLSTTVAWQQDDFTSPEFRPLTASESEPALQFFDQVGASTGGAKVASMKRHEAPDMGSEVSADPARLQVSPLRAFSFYIKITWREGGQRNLGVLDAKRAVPKRE